MTLFDSAQRYLAAGLCVLPANRKQKFPTVGKWGKYQKRMPTEAELSAWFANRPGRGGNSADAVCIVCGHVSNNLEIIDFDSGGEMFDPWCEKVNAAASGLLLLNRLAIESTQSGGWHVIYRCEAEICGSKVLAQRLDGEKTVTLIETRGQGGLFLCAPTQGYELAQDDLASLPVISTTERDILLQCAKELDECASTAGELSSHNANNGDSLSDNASMPGGDFNARGDIRTLLERHGWTYLRQDGENAVWRRPGKNHGQSATFHCEKRAFYVFTSSAGPFEMNQSYSPFAVYAILEHNGDFSAATRDLSAQGYGEIAPVATGVDISAIVAQGADPPKISAPSEDSPADSADITDPGLIPEHLFHIPGLVARVCDFTLSHAPYPNIGLAFCGAIALQSYLCGRKVRTPGDLRPNIYLLALASSGTGKDFPRKVNSRVLFEIGRVAALGDKFASGEGIQDALVRSNAMLFQNDEMDGVLRQINFDRENKRESIPNIMLTLYTSASDIYPVRVKAGQKEATHIDQPHLTLFGTATPKFFYESLSQRMLTNGLFARMMIVDIGKRGRGQTPGSPHDLPDGILQTARWWEEFCPGHRKKGNLYEMHPEPHVVPFTPEAGQAVAHLQRMGEDEYDKADAANDETGKVAWSRTCENAKKLALIYACSENHENPVIGLPAVEWATAFAMHQTRRQLYLATTYVAENPFHAECLKLLRKLRGSPGGRLTHSRLLKRMKTKAKDFRELIETLAQRGDIEIVTTPRAGSAVVEYVVKGGVK